MSEEPESAALTILQSPSEHETTQKAVAEFLKKDGPALHDRLVEYASTRASFIEEWWTESYLSHPDSVVLSLNPFFILECVLPARRDSADDDVGTTPRRREEAS